MIINNICSFVSHDESYQKIVPICDITQLSIEVTEVIVLSSVFVNVFWWHDTSCLVLLSFLVWRSLFPRLIYPSSCPFICFIWATYICHLKNSDSILMWSPFWQKEKKWYVLTLVRLLTWCFNIWSGEILPLFPHNHHYIKYTTNENQTRKNKKGLRNSLQLWNYA